MAKITQFGRMKRRIKRELEAARLKNALGMAQASGVIAAGMAQVNMIRSTIITGKMVRASIEAMQDIHGEKEDERLP